MIDLQYLNKTYNKNWNTVDEIDWVWIAKNMEPDLEFMKKNAINLLPGFVCENPKLNNEDGMLNEIYMEWIEYVNENVEYPKQTDEIVRYLNEKIQNDEEFPEDTYLENYEGIVGFCGMDQGNLFNEKIYLNNSDLVISKDTSWDETKKLLLNLLNSGEESADFWDKVDAIRDEIEDLSKEDLLIRLHNLRELTQYDEEMSEEDLINEIVRETLNNEDTSEEDDSE